MKGNRKFYVTISALAGAILLALLGKLTGDYATVASVCVGAFAAANAFEHKYKAESAAP